jgi:hypothetical protein
VVLAVVSKVVLVCPRSVVDVRSNGVVVVVPFSSGWVVKVVDGDSVDD